jgi:hypothetical protein
MLTKRMQVQLIADRMAGLEATARASDFQMPWKACWMELDKVESGQEQDALRKALEGFPDPQANLQAILATRPGYQPDIPSLADIADELPPIEWVWNGKIPRGLLSVLGASQGSGKSFMATDLAFRIIHNQGFPDGATIQRPGANIIYVDAEMVPQILNERAQAYHLDRSKLFPLLAEPGEALDLGKAYYQDQLSEMAARLQPELIIIDSLSSAHSNGQNNVEDLRALLGFLTRLAGWADCGLLLVHHIRKPSGGGQHMMNLDLDVSDLSGSGYITQQARVVLSLRVIQTGPEFNPNGPRELKVIKNNLGAYDPPLGFSFVPAHPSGVILKWDKNAPKPYKEPTQFDECKEWLEDLLRGNPEGVKARDVVAAGETEGFKRDMVYRARKELGNHIQNTEGRKAPGNCWKWAEESLPDFEEADD